jgi:hypothetical protein
MAPFCRTNDEKKGANPGVRKRSRKLGRGMRKASDR